MNIINKLIEWVDSIFKLFGPFSGWFVIALLLVSLSKVFSSKFKISV